MGSNSKTISLQFTGDAKDLAAAVAESDAALKTFQEIAGNTDGFDKLRNSTEKLRTDLSDIGIKVQADLDAAKLRIDAQKAADQATAKIKYQDSIDKAQLLTDAERAAAEAKATIQYKADIDAADLKARAALAAEQAKADLKIKTSLDGDSLTQVGKQFAAAGQAISKNLTDEADKGVTDSTASWAGAATKWTSIIVGALGLGAPLVGGAAAALGVAAVGAVGVALVKGSDDIKSSWQGLTQTFLTEGEKSASVITGPISGALQDLTTLTVQEKPNLDALFAGVSKDIPIFESSLRDVVNSFMPQLVSLFQHSEPIVQGVGNVFSAVGGALGTVFQDIANDAPTIKKDLDGLAPTIQNIGSILGNLITIGSNVGGALNPVLQGLSTLVSDITNILSGGENNPKFNLDNPIWGTDGVIGTVKGKIKESADAAAAATPQIDDTANAVINLATQFAATSTNTDQMTKDITAFESATSDAKTAAQAFADELAGLGQHGQEQVNSFLATAQLDLDGFAKSLAGTGKVAVDNSGQFDIFTKAGANLQKQMMSAQTDIGQVAGAMHEAGDSTAQINDAVTRFDGTLEKGLMQSLHLTKTEADGLITQFGLWPGQVDTTIGINDAASPLLKDIGGEINNLPDHDSKISAATQAAADQVSGLANQIFGIPDGFFSLYANPSPAEETLNNLINTYSHATITLHTAVTGGGSLSSQLRATGGPVTRGRSYIIGENGPEWFTPNVSGSVTSNSDTANGMAASGSTHTVLIPIDLSDQISIVVQAQLDESFRVISQKVRAGAGK
jgi:hypothetical protein